MTAHHLTPNDVPPTLPPLNPNVSACGNCGSWSGFGSGAGGRCRDPESPRHNAIVTRSTCACAVFARAAQLVLNGV